MTGSSRATVIAGPMPGSTPTAVPRITPSAAQARLVGVSAVANPLSRSDSASIYKTPSSGPAGRPMPSPRAKIR